MNHYPVGTPTPKPVITPFSVEAVIVCVNYDDFLVETLPNNKNLFDRVVVVTSYEDKRTQKVCEFHHVECVVTEVMQTHKGNFCKGAGINQGLDKLSKKDWVLHLDADIWLPHRLEFLSKRLL